MRTRWSILVVLVSLAACRFDPGGTGLGSDDTAAVDATAGGVDAAGPIDASVTTPIDAAETPGPITCGGATCASGTICCVDFDGSPACTTEQNCQGTRLTCDQPDDCPDQACCLYGGFGSTCSRTCIGGDRVCDTAADCGPGAGQCCPTNLGPKVCRAVCF